MPLTTGSRSMPRGRGFLRAILVILIIALGATPAAVHAAGTLERVARKALAEQDEVLLHQVLDRVDGELAAEHAPLLLEIAARAPTADVFERSARLLERLGPAVLAGRVAELLEDDRADVLVLGAALHLAAEWEAPEAERWALQLLERDSPTLQRNAIHLLVSRRSRDAIPALIDLLERLGMDSGTSAWEARRALISLTGQDFASVADWRKFWEANAAHLDPAALDGEESGNTAVARVRTEMPRFFGVEIVSRRVMFVIDVSGSMTMYDEAAEEGGEGSDWRVRQRLRRTQAQLCEAIEALASDADFNVIAFNDQITTFQPRLVRATNGVKRRARAFVARLEADQATHTDEALAAAFADPQVDTIILLSDGAPMKSKSETHAELIPRIIDQVRNANRLRRVKIFTFGFEGEGKWPPGSKYAGHAPEYPGPLIDFLEQLARENGGTYTPIR